MTDNIWAEESIFSTLEKIGLSAGADADLPDEVRFVRRVREIVDASAARRGPLSAPAVYIYAPTSSASLPHGATFHPRIHTGEVDPAGEMWFVGAAVKSGHHLSLNNLSATEVFRFCHELGFGASPAVYCDAGASPAIFAWYPNGFSEPDNVIEGPIDRATAPSLADLIEVVDRIHRTRFMTRRNQNQDTTLWQDPAQHHVHERAEKRVQDALMAGLGGAFGRPYFVEQERTGHAGRFDIGFLESVPGSTPNLRAILELKVAKSFGSGGSRTSPGSIRNHIVGGVEQCAAYRLDHGGEAACLVFDLRKLDAQREPPAAQARATQLDVVLKFWRCFPTAEDYRTFVLPAAP